MVNADEVPTVEEAELALQQVEQARKENEVSSPLGIVHYTFLQSRIYMHMYLYMHSGNNQSQSTGTCICIYMYMYYYELEAKVSWFCDRFRCCQCMILP